MCMPLRTSQEAPSFNGAAHSLSRYLMTIEALCQDRQRTTAPELIKWAVYYADEMSEDTFVAVRDALTDPPSWDDFKHDIREAYHQHEDCYVNAPLASLPRLPVPSALPAAIMLAPEALQVLLSLSAPSTLPLPPLCLAQSMPPAAPVIEPNLPSSHVPSLPPLPFALPTPSASPAPPPVSEPQPQPSPCAPPKPLAERWPSAFAAPAPMPACAPLPAAPSVPVSPLVPPQPPLLPCAPLLPTPPVPSGPVPPFAAVKPPRLPVLCAHLQLSTAELLPVPRVQSIPHLPPMSASTSLPACLPSPLAPRIRAPTLPLPPSAQPMPPVPPCTVPSALPLARSMLPLPKSAMQPLPRSPLPPTIVPPDPSPLSHARLLPVAPSLLPAPPMPPDPVPRALCPDDAVPTPPTSSVGPQPPLPACVPYLMPPPRDPSLPEADPAPAITARVAVLKAPVGIRESRRRMRRIGRRVFQVF